MFGFYKNIKLFIIELSFTGRIFSNFFKYIENIITLDFYEQNRIRSNLNTNKIVKKEKFTFFIYGEKNVRDFYKKLFFNSNNFMQIDLIWTKLFASKYLITKNSNLFRSYFRSFSTNSGFYFNLKNLKRKNNYKNYLMNTLLSGFNYFWLSIKFWLAPLLIFFLIIYFTIVLRSLPFNKLMFGWICFLMFVYWLVSGFVFFFKKYQFGKYTTSVQRFWRRSYILFWAIEGGTFSVFLFFTLNSSQESFYMYDQINIFKTHLYSWKFFLLKLFPIIILLISTYLLIISTKWSLFNKNSLLLLVLTFLLSYIVWLEFYQFFHVVNFYGNLNWIYDIDDHTWSLELEPRRTRIVNHYVMLLFILKFWHIVFIYGFWIFFVLRCWEIKRIRFPLLSANFQNFVILYIFAWVFMYPWFKFYLRKFLDMPYYWFYVNNRKIPFRVLFNDIKLFYYGIIFFIFETNLIFFNKSNFFYFKALNYENNFNNHKKSIIKDRIIINLTNLKY